MANIRTVDFLPPIFQTPVNRQFLDATLDQLIQEPAFQKTQGYVGRRVGPGVNPTDRYVLEPTKDRNDYQLEPGVISLDPGTRNIKDAITLPGIVDALAAQGAYTENRNSLYTSEYYTWDPFVDFDKFVNYSQYYWLPGGPDSVTVQPVPIPIQRDFVVTRNVDYYSIEGFDGRNPEITLLRSGNYNFLVSQNQKETISYTVQNQGSAYYVIDQQNNPTLTLTRGNTYIFNLALSDPYRFYIKTQPTLGTTNLYSSGVQNNGAITGSVIFTVPQDAPDTLYYINSTQPNLQGMFTIVDGVPGTGPDFYIQTDPGIDGRVPTTPNISSREVLGVINNGVDLGTVRFNVPNATAQNFYYNLPAIGTVDFATELEFNQINNVPVADFLEAHDGIDGVTDFLSRTIVFVNQSGAGWTINSLPSPGVSNPYGYPDPIDNQDLQTSIWKINKVTVNAVDYIQLQSLQAVPNFYQFPISFGNQYSSTNWYRNASGELQRIPLLTAARERLYYQDSVDPRLYGRIKLVDESNINVDIDILGQQTYTSPNGVKFTNGLKVTFQGNVIPSSYQNKTYYVEGVGVGIKLLPVTNFVTPEVYTQSFSVPYDSTPYDVGNYDQTLNAPILPEYVTINRDSADLNPWSRSNRWFHIDVINEAAALNGFVPVVDNRQRARRPILEFRGGTRLFDFGTEGKQPVDVIDFSADDALSQINGTTSYYIDGYQLVQGSRIIFAADSDPQVRNKIYQVEIITPDTVAPLIAEPIINLVPAPDAEVLVNNSTVCLSGITQQGKSFYFDGVEWFPAQSKTSANQTPLFDVYDADEVSFSNRAKYPSTTFKGSKLFSYAAGTGTADPVLGFPLRYLSLANVGDIVFDNNLYTDTFSYTKDNVGQTINVSEGFVRQYSNRLDYTKEIGWQVAATPSLDRQQFRFVYDGAPLLLDVAVDTNNVVPAIQLYVNSKFVEPTGYSYTTTSTTTVITLNNIYVPGDIIEVAVLSNQISKIGFYQVPLNLENNPFNNNSPTFTLGTIRSHYETIGQNLLTLNGPIIGQNNSRDLGDIGRYGTQIIQNSSPLTMAGYFMRSAEYDIFGALEYNSREYIKFKSLLLDTVVNNDYGSASISQILDLAIAQITVGRTNNNPFYWSDMLPTGSVYQTTTYVVTPLTNNTFNTIQTYDYSSANYLGLNVYLTVTVDGVKETRLLTRGTEYTVAVDGPRITLLVQLNVGDVVTLNEYSNTAGSFVPNTPSKMGLYPKYVPQIFLDPNYIDPTFVIQGHDGSITLAFGDYRDEILLEFEKRIYNNIKVDGNPIPLTFQDVAPGFFRTTDYTQTQINDILSESFLTWVGWNKLDYKDQFYLANNAFTWNYSTAGNKVNNKLLPGAWRGISRYFYDTLSPNLTPWEMLGLSEKPDWWETRYGPAPYTSDNLVLWEDLSIGLVADPVTPYVKPLYARSGLSQVIPNGSEGQLLAPIESVVGPYDPNDFQKSWTAGDGGPTESSWWTSSSYPFAVMRLLLLTRPAEFFSLFADRDLYRYDADLGQYLLNGRYRLDANGVQVYGNGISKASYINWIVDYNQQLGRNSTDALTQDLANLDVRLCYRMASFTDKQYLKIYVERSSPDSTNSSLLLPDTSYNILLYKNTPFSRVTYSSLIVERTSDGYAVYGYNNAKPYFNILASSSGGVLQTVSAGNTTVRVPATYTNNVVQIPYGYVFTNTTVVVDFILSYGAWLASQGLIFDDRENNYTLNWNQMAQEFLYWNNQGWGTGSIINLNPAATTLKAFRAGAVIDTIESVTPENMVLDQNKVVLPTRDLIVQRDGNDFSVTSGNGRAISYLNLRYTSYEDMVVLDNVSIFNDLIYDPTTGARQSRIKVVAATSTEWNGVLNAQGFILNRDNVREWVPNRRYAKGEIVLYKNNYWQASAIVQPKVEFDYNDWYKSNWDRIQQGLLPNLANKADQLANSYNTQTANLERDNDLLGYGLIGFRPRQYMSDLNLDDVSQVNLYQQFLPTKGTRRALELFTDADLGKETGQYSIYENWGILASTYGANANKSFVELRLNEAYLKSDPSTVQVVQPQQESLADQKILVQNIWRDSYNITNPDIFTTTLSKNLDTALPSAGYVNIDDVDITVFSLDDPASISRNIDQIGVGTTIWAAKSNSYDWNVYRCDKVPAILTSITNNLNNTSIAEFSAVHNLVYGDLIVIRFFDDNVNGVYRVLSTPTIYSITIAYQFNLTNQTTLNGIGLAFVLDSMRVAQPSDVAMLPYANILLPGVRAYVDSNVEGRWEVLEKTDPFVFTDDISPDGLNQDDRFGAALAQDFNHATALMGAPGVGGAGIVYSYKNNNDNTTYIYNGSFVLEADDVVGFGSAISTGNQSWSAVGAPDSYSGMGYVGVFYQNAVDGSYKITQLLVPPDGDTDPIGFGKSVAVSRNEQFLYVGAPYDTVNGGKVYAYGRVNVETQAIRYSTDGVTTLFPYNDSIVIDYNYPDQLTVVLNNRLLVAGYDFTLSPTNVVFTTPPSIGQTLSISRTVSKPLDKTVYPGITPTSTSGSGTGAVFTVTKLRGSYSVGVDAPGLYYANGDTITIAGTSLGGASPANNLVLTLTNVFGGGVQSGGFTQSGAPVGNTSVFTLKDSFYVATNIDSFTVTVTGAIQRPNIDYTFDPVTTDLTFLNNPASGAVIDVTADTHWRYIGTAIDAGLAADAQFGISVSTTGNGQQLVVGANQDSALDANSNVVTQAGQIYVYDRSVVRYEIVDPEVLTYSMPGTVSQPVTVTLNNQLLTVYNFTDAANITRLENLDGQVDIDLYNNTISIVSTVTLTAGDILEINTNQFQLIEQFASENPLYQASYGQAVAVSENNCTIFIGAPKDNFGYTLQAGSVERVTNQSQTYGVTTSTIANPTLTVGDTIRINNTEVAVPTDNTVQGLAAAISSANISNVVAVTTPDAVFRGNNRTKVFNIGDLYASASSYTTVVYIDDVLQTAGVDYTYNPTTFDINFVYAPANNSVVTVVSGRLTISVKNAQAAVTGNLVSVLPGLTGTAFADLGWETYVITQTFQSPNPSDFDNFGAAIAIDVTRDEAVSEPLYVVIGAPHGNAYEAMTFDRGQTYFDQRSTTFSNTLVQSGVAYTFDYLESKSNRITDPGMYVFGQQIYSSNTQTNDGFGSALSYANGRLIVGAPGSDLGDSSLNYGLVKVFDNPLDIPAWKVIHQESPVVDVDLINGAFMYDRLISSTQIFFDFIDPLQGKILGAARRNIDYIGAVDPANYTEGSVHNNNTSWGAEHVGEIWWDTDRVRFIDPNQDNIVYAARRWAQTFPGSQVDIYQWVESDVPPASYTAGGTPLSVISYSVRTALTTENIFVTKYYFWVRNINTINTGAGKTLSTTGIASYISNPRGSGIPYLAFLNSSTIAIYNGLDYISAADTLLHVDYDREFTESNVHQEFQLIASGKADSFLSDSLYRKLQDSFCGITTTGASVPDPLLSPGERYGVQFRPRQSMFADRYTALKNYLVSSNATLKLYPIVEIRNFSLLNSSEPEPAAGTGVWNMKVANLEELSYQNIYAVPLGYIYLVESASTQNGLWSLYEVIESVLPGTRTFNLIRVQNYDTKLYWYYINWYQPGYNSTIQPIAEVPNFSALSTLTVNEAPIGSSVKVTSNAQGKFEIYLRTTTGWDRVGLQDGTIQFKEELWNYAAGNFGYDTEVFDAQYFDQEPVIETRKIIQAINEELFIDDLAIVRNQLLILMFEYIYSEFTAPDWLIKTSLVDVNHKIRALLPFQNYLQDNQTFVLDYIQEVKPYHVQITNFNLTYDGLDLYPGSLTDFDVPAYWDKTLEFPQFISPVLTPYELSNSRIESTISDKAPDDQIWIEDPWKQWYNNHTLSLLGVAIANGGAGYTSTPDVIVTGDAIVPAVLTATINSAGRIIKINVINAGSGYLTTPSITVIGGNGIGARLVPIMGNDLVRSIKTTIKYDRCEYTSSVVDWEANVVYPNGTLVRYLDRVWEADNLDGPNVQGPQFDIAQWTLVNSGTLSGADRTRGYYTPGTNEPGLSLPLLIDGIDYPGVQVFGLGYNFDTGFDVGNYDITPYDNISYGPEGRPTYDPALLDTIYESYYGVKDPLNPGTYIIAPEPPYPPGPIDVNVEGGAYVDVYSSHAPEELIPGAVFDTLDLRVYTTPGSDWGHGGHGFPSGSRRYVFDPANPNLNFDGIVPNSMVVILFNVTLGLAVEPASYDWVNYTLDATGAASAGDLLDIYVTSVGGGNQLYYNTYLGSDIVDQIIVPFPYASIYEFVIYNGETYLLPNVDYTWEVLYRNTGTTVTYNSEGSFDTTLIVTSTLGIDAGALITGTGFTSGQTVVSVDSLTKLTISAAPDSAPDGNLTFYPDSGKTQINFNATYGANDRINLATLGYGAPGEMTYSWSAPVFQTLTSDGSTTVTLTQSMQGTNPVNLVVTVNGVRARPPAGARYMGDDSTVVFELPTRGGYSQEFIANNDVEVYVDNMPLTLNVDFVVDAWDGSSIRTVTLASAPLMEQMVLVSVRTNAQYFVVGDQLFFQPSQGLSPSIGDLIEITSWNDTSEQDLLTQVFVGPTTQGVLTSEPYDSTNYDPLFDTELVLAEIPGPFTAGTFVIGQQYEIFSVGTTDFTLIGASSNTPGVQFTATGAGAGTGQAYGLEYARSAATDAFNNDPESFDFSTGVQIQTNVFDTGRVISDSNRVLVTHNGYWLFCGVDFVIDGTAIVISGPPIGNADVIAITTFTNGVVPGAMAFRIFQDMRGVQATYRITPETTTTLAQPLSATDDIIYVDNAGALDIPDFAANIWGVITIDGERIMYREIDYVNNTVSSLLRGTAGTAAADHDTGALVYQMGRGNLLNTQYQNYVVSDSFLGDGSTSTYTANSIDLGTDLGPEDLELAVEVYVGGIRLESGFTISATDPVTIVLDDPVPNGVDITILVRRGVNWYEPGINTPSNGVPLQDTDTIPARFLRGL